MRAADRATAKQSPRSPERAAEHPIVRALPADDERWNCRQVVEVVSTGTDPQLAGIGGDAYPGSMGVTGVPIPATALPGDERYFIRLGAIEIPKESGLVILALRMQVLIGDALESEDKDHNDGKFLAQLSVTSPQWSFQDGNISWHVRHQPNRFTRNNPSDATAEASGVYTASSGLENLTPGVLYNPPFAPYNPPGRGVPPGVGVGSLGTIRDLRYPWTSTDWPLNTFVRGPGVLAFYASVKQTNPETRVKLPEALTEAQAAMLGPEDGFLWAFQETVYTRVAGSMIVDLIPNCSRNVEQGGTFSPLERFPKQCAHGDLMSLTSLTSPKGK